MCVCGSVHYVFQGWGRREATRGDEVQEPKHNSISVLRLSSAPPAPPSETSPPPAAPGRDTPHPAPSPGQREHGLHALVSPARARAFPASALHPPAFPSHALRLLQRVCRPGPAQAQTQAVPPPVDDADAAAARAASAAALEAAVFSGGRLASVSNWADSDDEFAGVEEGGEWVSREREGWGRDPPRRAAAQANRLLLSPPADACSSMPTPPCPHTHRPTLRTSLARRKWRPR